MIRLDITVPDIAQVLAAGYTVIRVYTDTSESGTFTTLDGTVTLVANTSGYSHVDTNGTTSTWYKTAYFDATPGESSKSDAQQGGTMDAYCTALDVRQELSTGSGRDAVSDAHDHVLWNMAVEASRWIDDFKRIEHGAYLASTSATRDFFGSGIDIQNIDYAVSISVVAVEETDGTYTTWTADTDFYTWPYSGDEPIRKLEVNLKSDGSKSVWTHGQKRVRVTGVWGVTATPPEPIVRACKILAASMYKRAQQGWSITGGTAELGQIRSSVEIETIVKEFLVKMYPRRIGI